MNMRSLCPEAAQTVALAVALILTPMAALPLPVMGAEAVRPGEDVGMPRPALPAPSGQSARSGQPGQPGQSAQSGQSDQSGQPGQPGVPAAAAFRHIPKGPLRGAVGEPLVIQVASSGTAEGQYTLEAVVASGPGGKGPEEPAAITVDDRFVRFVARQPGVYVIEVRGMREGLVS